MSKSGQPATKADTGGQRVPKSDSKTTGSEKKAVKSDSPAKKGAVKKPGS